MRAITFVFALVGLVGHLSSLAHVLLVPHATCLEHGELVHRFELTEPAELETPAVSEGSTAMHRPLARFTAAPPATVGHEHHHCALLAHRSGTAARRGAAASWRVQPTFVAYHDIAPASPVPDVVCRILLAPKNSPPN